MNLGFAVFIASDVLGAVAAVVLTRRTFRRHGRTPAVKEAVLHALMLGAYTAVCVCLGYGMFGQFIACVAVAFVFVTGAVLGLTPALDEYFATFGGDR